MGTYWGADGKTVDGRFEAILKNSNGAEIGMGAYGNIDSANPTDIIMGVSSRQELFNETTWDRQRGNTQGTLFAGAARTATLNSANQTNYNARGLYAILNVTAAPVTPGAGGLALSIVGIDPISGNIFAINPAATAITTTGFFAYEIYPGASSAVAGTGSFSTVQRTAASIPRNWLARMNHNDAQSYTYSLSYLLTL